MFERILFGYAGDRAGRDAAVLAERLARLCAGKLSVAFPYHPMLATVPGEVSEQRVRDELHSLLGDSPMLADARYHWANSSWPIRALQELADWEGADLIVFGAAPVRLERRHVSVMERMVHGAPCAVALAPAGYADSAAHELRSIGVGFADTEEGRAAVELAHELAVRASARLQLIAGAGLSPELLSYAAGSPALPAAEAEIYDQTKAAAERVAGELLPGEGCEVDVRRGDACRLLLEAGERLDLLVLGSRAYGPIRHALLGGVSAAVMRGAQCPVLVVPRGVQVAGAPTAATARGSAEG
ncbi:MAG: universal stress protein [Solirubrobacterales bacterium]